MPNTRTIVWFRQDLRLTDNPALSEAASRGDVLPIYILDDDNAGEYSLGGASRWWLHHSLAALNESLEGKLRLYQGDAKRIINELCQRFSISNIYWNRCYEPWRIARDKDIKEQLREQGIHVHSFNGSLLHEPWEIKKKDATPYKIYTPYYRQASVIATSSPLPKPDISLASHTAGEDGSLTLQALGLLPEITWYTHMQDMWKPGEAGAQASLYEFLDGAINDYKIGRDFPSLNSVSKLSPHLHFGEISPREILQQLKIVPDDNNTEHFKKELAWREFSYYLLFHFPQLPNENLKPAFNHFPWQHNQDWLECWQQGKTGYPIVDAGMRELWQTGYMHNRVRMITASFLVKNLLIDWRHGAAWFWDCLVDADLASNSASWQWVAGCGTDAAPYFRIFNPVTQGEKFDADGEYTRRFIPELSKLPNKYLFKPWEAPADILHNAGVQLDQNYPMPIVEVKASREIALEAFKSLKSHT